MAGSADYLVATKVRIVESAVAGLSVYSSNTADGESLPSPACHQLVAEIQD